MAGFRELWPFGGVGPWIGSTFMVAPKNGANLVILEGASPRELVYDHQKFDIIKVTHDNKLKLGQKLNPEAVAHLAPAPASLKQDSHLIAVTKNHGTEDAITIGKGGVTLKVGLFPPRRYSLAFKFLQHDAKTRPSKWNPTHAAGWLAALNTVYGPQANISFEIAGGGRLFHGRDHASAADRQQGVRQSHRCAQKQSRNGQRQAAGADGLSSRKVERRWRPPERHVLSRRERHRAHR